MSLVLSRLGIISLAVLITCSLPTITRADIISLTNDSAQTSAAAFGTTKEGPLNDPFAYDPLNPGGALPIQDFTVSPPALWHSPNGASGATYAVLFDEAYKQIFVDYYARTDDPSAYNRDDNLTVQFFNGDWGTAVHTETGFSIDNVVANSNRLTIPVTVEADRFRITTTATNWSIAELRANGVAAAVPEPSSFVLLLVAGSVIGFFQWRRASRKASDQKEERSI